MVKFKVGDTVAVAISWDLHTCPSVGSTATITKVDGAICRLKWDGYIPQYNEGSWFSMTPWFEHAGGPW